jgi:uncharacterized damage-inducible protein DinB
MPERIQTIKTYTQIGFDRLAEATQKIKPEQLDWRSCSEANTIRWILTHLAEELQVYIPQFVPTVAPPKNWPKDYVGNASYSLEKITADIDKGKNNLMKGLDKLAPAKLDEEVDMWGTKQKRDYAIMMMISEVLHHEGQIAAILGLEGRMKGKKK